MILRTVPLSGPPNETIVSMFGVKSPEIVDKIHNKNTNEHHSWESKELLKMKARNIPLFVAPASNSLLEFYQEYLNEYLC